MNTQECFLVLSDTKDRYDQIKRYSEAKNGIMINCGVLTTGFDCPSIEVGILWRATKSYALYNQMVGRCARFTETKKIFTILDFGNNITRHNLWECPPDFTLEPEKTPKEGVATVKECKKCGALIHASKMECEHCGYIFVSKKKPIIAEELILYSEVEIWFRRLEMERIRKGYKLGWIFHQLKTFSDFQNYGKLKGYHPAWAKRQWDFRTRNPKSMLSMATQ